MELRERIHQGKRLFGYCQTYGSPGIVENACKGWDWLWIDTQHSEIDIGNIAPYIRAADLAGVPSIVRVPELTSAYISRALDNNATGVMVPMVNTRAQAEEAVAAARFPPEGGRSFAGRRVCDLHTPPGYLSTAASRTVVVLQIETKQAVENAAEIASVPGVDVLLIGPTDLRLSLGLDMATPLSDPVFTEAAAAVVSAAKENGISTGTVAVSFDDIQWYLDMGLTFVAGAVDATAIREDSANRLQRLEGMR